MPATLTLKNIPDNVYERLKVSAQTHHCSLNSEAAYDCEFVALAMKRATKLVTRDGKLLRAFPKLAVALSAR